MIGAATAGLLFKIDGDSSQLQKEFRAVDSSIDSLGGKVSTLGGAAAVGAAAIAAIGAAALTAGKVMFDLTRNAAEYASVIKDAQDKTGLTAETLTTLKNAADNSGGSLEQVTASTAKFAKLLGQARDGSKEAQATLARLGVTSYDLDTALGQATKTISQAADGTEQLVLAQKAFGKAGADMIPVIKQFGGNLDAAREQAERLGLTLTDKDVRAADDFGDALGLLSQQAKAAAVVFTSDLMPVMTEFFTSTSEWYARNKGEVREWGELIANTCRGIIVSFQQITGAVGSVFSWLDGRFASNAGAAEQWATRLVIAAVRAANAIATLGASEIALGVQSYLAGAGADANKVKSLADLKRSEDTNRLPNPFVKVPSIGGGGGGGRGKGGGGGGGADKAEQERKKALQEEEKADRQRLESYRAYLQKEEEALKTSLDLRIINETEYIRDSGNLKLQAMLFEKQLLETELENEKRTDEEKHDLRVKIQVLDYNLGRERIRIGNEVYEKISEQTKKELKEFEDAEKKKFEAVQKRKRKQQEADLEESIRKRDESERARNRGGDGYDFGIGGSFKEFYDQVRQYGPKITEVFASIKDIGLNAFGALAQGLGSVIESWVLMGDLSGEAIKKMVASVLAGVAAQAAVLAIFELAKGFAALFFNPAEAAAHFTAAALFGSVAAATGLAGRAVAGDSFKQHTSGGGASNQQRNDPNSPYSRSTENAFQSGQRQQAQNTERLTKAIEGLHNKITGMRPGEVLARGAAEKPGLIGNQAVKDVKSNSGIGRNLNTALGFR